MRASIKAGGQTGFTLMEAMISVAILGMIGMLTLGTFARGMQARDRAEQITTRYHQMRQALQRMATEIAMAYLSEHKDCEEPRTETIFATRSGGHGRRLDFVSFSHYKLRADANESDQNELSYYVDRHPDDPQRSVLMRREQARIDEEPTEGGDEQVLAEDVTDLRFQFYDAKEDRWEEDWDSTNLDQKGRMPAFVKIEITALDPQGKEEKLVTATRIMIQNSLLFPGAGFSKCLE